MSGGVDSSTAALLLKESGHRIVGVTMKLLEDDESNLIPDSTRPSGRTCCSFHDIIDARSVSQKLNFDHQVHNFSRLFREKVIERFARDYAKGWTPNPCVECNRQLKFGPLYERAVLLGCSKLATGHYAKIELDPNTNRWLLKQARDKTKDQSYFLYGLTQEELSRTYFPIGDYLKEEIREIASSRGIVNARKPDSQDICFVPDGRYDLFLEEFGLTGKPGHIINRQGKILGSHQGIFRYTVGQRRGLGIPAATPLYVLELDQEKNTVTIGTEEELVANWALINDVNLISLEQLTSPLEVEVKIRYRQPAFKAMVVPFSQDELKIIFHKPQKAVAPGQAAVMYQGEVVVGGGTIISSG
ncbi:MAG: tRNA 2-thiouridine(34) synthase MnmA [Deltaproteobacteria bacterium]|nr:tRNA 2-thiouridine(34) synthase MnmA [Deltaproteobacteria bacterium]